MQAIISIVISLALSFSLISGVVQLSQFAFYVCAALNVLSWIVVLTGQVKYDVAEKIRKEVWIRIPPSVFYLYALIFSGHPLLAASSFMVQAFILGFAFSKQAKPA
ncbi:hypothetical protein ACM7LV_20045 [Pseudomonas aeruginosa]|uniref:hypothetical protein n=1 Tax=Pseudomonas TaxID=286 RepID=UPI000E678122|nr:MULTISPECIES: hypothetical protein [Pseudomonas]ELB6601125.1 hypothetical protein [Pseudomonas aeruginosa]ELH7228207.1 hypothetical protein [Pseudomonas aeruginosa]ELT7042364.1 hypothetical protein [Pseudomonas aeruginosa]MBV5699072.1 hypothetical protein [Pseudomonas aeruginosa]MCD2852705.1 hypothetical protein [Pseudomonas aeruginosa]